MSRSAAVKIDHSENKLNEYQETQRNTWEADKHFNAWWDKHVKDHKLEGVVRKFSVNKRIGRANAELVEMRRNSRNARTADRTIKCLRENRYFDTLGEIE